MRRIGATFRRVPPPHGAAACYDGVRNCSRGVFRCRSAVFRRQLPVLRLHCCLPLRPLRRQLRGIGPGARTRVTPIRPTAKSKAAPRSSMPARRPEKIFRSLTTTASTVMPTRSNMNRRWPTTITACGSIPTIRSRTATAVSPITRSRNMTGRSPITTRRSGSIRATTPPSTAAAARITTRKTTTARSRTNPKP